MINPSLPFRKNACVFLNVQEYLLKLQTINGGNTYGRDDDQNQKNKKKEL